MKHYINELGTQEHLATLTDVSIDDCETQAMTMFGVDREYGWTEEPNFGQPNSLKFNPEAVKLTIGNRRIMAYSQKLVNESKYLRGIIDYQLTITPRDTERYHRLLQLRIKLTRRLNRRIKLSIQGVWSDYLIKRFEEGYIHVHESN